MQTRSDSVAAVVQQVLGQVRKVIVGKDATLLWVMAAMLSGGHILLEDIPGVGKTTMAVAFSKVLGLSYNRVQFTPDVLPSDVTGYSVLDQNTGKMTYQKGAVLCNLFLADELNRATSRTQSALLEAMEEGQVTVDGNSYKLPEPFIVVATQNPAGAAGTQLLPDSQMDRFSMRLSLGYPDPEHEVKMVLTRQGKDPMKQLQPLLDAQTLAKLQEEVAQTHACEDVVSYVVALIDATRHDELILRGGSPRATLSVMAVSRAVAQLRGRDYVTPKDVQEVFLRTVAHRILLSPKALSEGVTQEEALRRVLERVNPPKIK